MAAFGFQSEFRELHVPAPARSLMGYGAGFKERGAPHAARLSDARRIWEGPRQPENRVTVDPNRVDAHGIPIPVVRFRFDGAT